MVWNKKLIFSEIRDILILAAVGLLITWSGLACRDCIDNTREFWIIASFASLLWIALWKGNAYLGSYVTRRVSWLTHPERKFFLYLIFTIVYTFGVMYLIGFIYQLIFSVYLTRGAFYSVIIAIIISLFMHGRSFLINWKASVIDAERLHIEHRLVGQCLKAPDRPLGDGLVCSPARIRGIRQKSEHRATMLDKGDAPVDDAVLGPGRKGPGHGREAVDGTA